MMCAGRQKYEIARVDVVDNVPPAGIAETGIFEEALFGTKRLLHWQVITGCYYGLHSLP